MCRLALKSALVVSLAAYSLTLSWAQGESTPRNFDHLAAQAEQARTANRLDEAVALYRKALSLRPRWAEGWWYLGALLYDRDKYAEAATALRRSATLNPKVGTTWVMLGLCEYQLGRNDEALKHIQRGRRLGVSADTQFRRVMFFHGGLLLLGKGDFEKAQETLGAVSREGVENEDLTIALGLSVLRILPSKMQPGNATLREVVLRAGSAEALAAQEKFDEALLEYERLTTEFPKEVNVHYALGRFLIASRHPDPERAVPAFQREIENFPEHVLARLGIASVKASTDPAGGLRYAEEAVKLNPHLPLGHYLLGSLLLHTDQTARAIQELEIARRSLPNEARIYYALGRAYARANRKQDAERARAIFKQLTEQAEKAQLSVSGPVSQPSEEAPAQSTRPKED